MEEQYITLAHGSGGMQTASLIGELFRSAFENEYFTADDAAVLPRPEGKIAMSTDGFIVSPPFFPGGNIGKLSICGTVNDLACMGAKPLYLTTSFVIEEGYPIAELKKIVKAMSETARQAGVRIVAGDTKVAGKGQVDSIFITTTGVGEVMSDVSTSGAFAKPGDVVIVTGDVGRHGTAIQLARNEYGIEADVTSDCAPLWQPVEAALKSVPQISTIRDATRGGVGTVLYEIAAESHVGIRLVSEDIPVDDAVLGVTGMLGLEPLYLACEGRLVMIVPDEKKEDVLTALKSFPDTKDAAVIGTVTEEHKGDVTMTTSIGTETFLPRPGNELLPRIC